MEQTNNFDANNGALVQDGYVTGYDANAYATAASAGADVYAQENYGMNTVPDYGQGAATGAAVAMSAATPTPTDTTLLTAAGTTDVASSASAAPVSPFAPADIPDMSPAGAVSGAGNAVNGGGQADPAATFAIPNLPQTAAPTTAPVASNVTAAPVQADKAAEVKKPVETATASTKAEEPKTTEVKTEVAKPAEAKTDEQPKKPNVLKNEIPKTALETTAVTAKPAIKKPETKKETAKETMKDAAKDDKATQTVAGATVKTTPLTSGVPSGLTIEALLEECIRRNSSDLHLQAGLPPILRVDGALYPITDYPVLDDGMVQQLVLSTLDADQKVILARDKEFDYSFAFGDLGRFRVNAFHEKGNMAAAFRLIPNVIKSIDDLGLPGVVSTFADHPNGLVLVTGPTGSGKSTTLAALVDKINTERAVHIITIEDPIEFTHHSKRAVVAQREVHYDTFSFAAALRSILREDPDVVLIGEMRDLETIQAAITVAETGHLVFATLHTNSAAQSIDRMIDVFPAHQQPQIRAQLANILVGICSQRLVPAITGGRVAVTEILVTNSAVRSIIREGKTHQLDMTIQTGMSQGMQTMDRELAKYVKTGIISYDNAREYAVDVTEFDRLARG